MTAVVIVEAVVIVLLLALVAGLLKSHAEILRRLDRLSTSGADTEPTRAQQPGPTGLGEAPVDEITGVDRNGSTVTVSLRHGKGETLLAFLTTGCASCRMFWDELAQRPEMPTPGSRPVIVTKGPESESPGKVRELAPDEVNLIMSDEAWDSFRVPLTPYFMLVGGDGTVIGEGSSSNMANLRDLLRQSAADADPVHLSTRERERFTDDQLGRSGIAPGDPSLYEDPLHE